MLFYRPAGYGRRDFLSRADALLNPKTPQKRRWQLRRMAKRLSAPLEDRIPKQSTAKSSMRPRRRAQRATLDDLRGNLLAKHQSFETWEGFKTSKGHYGIYKDSVIALQRKLTQDLPVHTNAQGAFLDGFAALPLFLALAAQYAVCHAGNYRPALCLFVDANNMYDGRKCQLVCLSLPQAKQPHQLPLQLRLARCFGEDDHVSLWRLFVLMSLVEVLKVGLQTMLNGQRPRLV